LNTTARYEHNRTIMESCFYLVSDFLILDDVVAIASCCKSYSFFALSTLSSVTITNPSHCHISNFPRLKDYVSHARQIQLAFPCASYSLDLVDVYNILSATSLHTLNMTNLSISESPEMPTALRSPASNVLTNIRLVNINCSRRTLYLLLTCSSAFTNIHISSCMSLDDRIADLVLHKSNHLKTFAIDKCVEMTGVHFPYSSVRIKYFAITRCPRVNYLSTNCVLINCDLSNTSITSESLQRLVQQSNNLTVLCAQGCNKLTFLRLQSYSLKHLNLADSTVVAATLHTPNMTLLNTNNCFHLEFLDLNVRRLVTLSLVGLHRLRQVHISSLSMGELEIRGCNRILESSVRHLSLRSEGSHRDCSSSSASHNDICGASGVSGGSSSGVRARQRGYSTASGTAAGTRHEEMYNSTSGCASSNSRGHGDSGQKHGISETGMSLCGSALCSLQEDIFAAASELCLLGDQKAFIRCLHSSSTFSLCCPALLARNIRCGDEGRSESELLDDLAGECGNGVEELMRGGGLPGGVPAMFRRLTL
jgi:hypothetical protein